MLYTTTVASCIVAASAFQAGAPLGAGAVARAASPAMAAKQTPHGGKLIDLFVADKEAVMALSLIHI